MLADISGEVWEIQDGKKEAEKDDKEDGEEQSKEG
jgi:hypothetical protein